MKIKTIALGQSAERTCVASSYHSCVKTALHVEKAATK